MHPIGPLYSIGAISLKYFGQNKLKHPAAAPNRNRATHIAYMFFLSKHSKLPHNTNKLVNIIQFLLPMVIIGPIIKAPHAAPIKDKVLINVDLNTISYFILGSLVFSNSGKLTAK